jgi:N-acetylglucosaminyl-diphospho-decaprenol L-rhamnosyltransferase
MRSIDVVIVTYCSERTIIRCLRTLVEALEGRFDHRILVIDNASSDNTVSLVEYNFPSVAVVARSANDGFSVATNEGLRRVGGEFVLVLNPDTELSPGVIEHLVEVLDSNPDIGMIGPRLVRLDGTFDHAAKRRFPTVLGAARYLLSEQLRLPTGTSDYVAPEVDEHKFGLVDAINGAFMLLPSKTLQTVGLLDETFWMYAEDLDWCRRAWAAGLSVAYDGRVTAVHIKGASSGTHRPPCVNWHFHRSMWIFYRRYHRGDPAPLKVLALLGIAASLGLTMVRYYASRLGETSWAR